MNSIQEISKLIEREFVKIVDARAETQGLKKQEFAQLIWPEMDSKSASSKWTSIRKRSSKTGRPQGLLMEDGLTMAAVLGTEYIYLLAQARLSVESKLERRQENTENS